MPVYEYQCPTCKESWDETKSINDPAINRGSMCPRSCRRGRRVFAPTAPAVVFRGDGWARKAGAGGES